ncbi:GntR family transcriptional regulator [Anaerolentibacter hominis]|uniref:GntR family transcriptional regulator n=1 Tax=Anaerolentibacter hominis TaxID=3079009 RepID=UPI0031B887B7
MKNDIQIVMNEYLPLRDVVFETLERAILMGDLKPGERLMEIQLANRLGVSRTPIRDAIRKLELEGLVVMIPRKGAQVAKISEKSLKDVLEVRCVLEELAVELACNRITEDAIRKLKLITRDFKTAINNKDLTKIADKDIEFHDVIYSAGGNERLVQILNNLRLQMYRYRIEYLKDPSSHETLIREHEALIVCIEKKDVKNAREIMRNHIYNQAATVTKRLKTENTKE